MKVLGNCLDVEEEDNIPETLPSFQHALLTCIIAIYWLTADMLEEILEDLELTFIQKQNLITRKLQ